MGDRKSNYNKKVTLKMNNKDKYKELVQSIKADEEMVKEQNRFDATLEQTKETHALLQKSLDATKEANDNNAAIQKGLNAAALSANNILTRICAAIVKAENTPVKAKLDDDSIQQLNVLHDQWMEQEKQMLADHIIQQESLWHKQSHRLTDIVRNNEGVWLSQHLFYIVGSLSLLSIITIVLEIAFYVYFNWIT